MNTALQTFDTSEDAEKAENRMIDHGLTCWLEKPKPEDDEQIWRLHIFIPDRHIKEDD